MCCLLVYSILESLAGLESGNLLSGDLDNLFGLRILAFLSSSLAGLESTEAYECNLIAVNERIGNNVNYSGKSLFCFLLGGVAALCSNSSDELSFCHVFTSLLFNI